MSSGSKADQQDIGYLDGSTAKLTAPRYYDGTTDAVQIFNFDRLYLPEDILVPARQLVETNAVGRDKLNFPAVDVLDIIDAKGRRYTPDNYTIENGQIVWQTAAGPGFDLVAQKGVIYSVRYTYRPYFYVQRIMHQVRVSQQDVGDERRVVRMPQEFIIQREYVAEKALNDPQALDKSPEELARQHKAPREGLFGPR
jgi:hypothetical protein